MSNTLSQEKLDLIKALQAFYLDPKQQFFRIQGPPGSGKTVVVYEAVKSFIAARQVVSIIFGKDPHQTVNNVFLTATVNKAVAVLDTKVGQRIQKELNHNVITATIHSFLGLQIRKDYRTGKTYIAKGKGAARVSEASKHSLIILDEASYASSRIYDEIEHLAKVTDQKFIIIADEFQGTVINEGKSRFITDIPVSFTLKERWRYPADSAIAKNSIALEDELKGLGTAKMLQDSTCQTMDTATWSKKLNEFIDDGNKDFKVIAYHNNACVEYNSQINSYISKKIGRDPFQFYNEGDTYIANSTCTHPSKGRLVTNENEYRIDKIICESVYTVGASGESIDVLEVELSNVNYRKDKNTVLLPKSPNALRSLLSGFKKAKNWAAFFSAQENIVDLRHPWAITSHKSQGSDFDYVFVDFLDFPQSDRQELLTQLNVALTRARKCVFIRTS